MLLLVHLLYILVIILNLYCGGRRSLSDEVKSKVKRFNSTVTTNYVGITHRIYESRDESQEEVCTWRHIPTYMYI
jgi:hypothetical protein